MKTITAQQALAKLANYCSKSEHCIQDVQKKLDQWAIAPEIQKEIISYLIQEKYIDESRYCRAFIKDKSTFAKWGEIKILFHLKNKGIEDTIIKREWATFRQSADTKETLSTLLSAKNRQIKSENRYDRKQKLIRFALGRGFLYEEIGPVIEHILNQEEPCE